MIAEPMHDATQVAPPRQGWATAALTLAQMPAPPRLTVTSHGTRRMKEISRHVPSLYTNLGCFSTMRYNSLTKHATDQSRVCGAPRLLVGHVYNSDGQAPVRRVLFWDDSNTGSSLGKR